MSCYTVLQIILYHDVWMWKWLLNGSEWIKAGPPWGYFKNIKNDTTAVRMGSGDHLGDAKMLKKGTSLRRI